MVARAQGCRRAAEQIVERPEHQGERRSELVADVAEERRLGAVELGQRFRTLALFLVGRGLCHRRPDLCGDQIEEVAVVVPEGQEAAGAGDHEARRTVRCAQTEGSRSDPARRRRAARAPPRRTAVPGRAAGRCGRLRRTATPDRRALTTAGVERVRSVGAPIVPCAWASLPSAIEQVEAHERDVGPLVASAASASRHASAADRLSPARRQIAQGSQPALAEHASGRLADDAEDAADAGRSRPARDRRKRRSTSPRRSRVGSRRRGDRRPGTPHPSRRRR